MSYWSREQQYRLAEESALLRKYGFDHFDFSNPTQRGMTLLQGAHFTSANNIYQLCIWILSDYPYEMPGLYVISPQPLIGFLGKTIQSYGTSHSMHVWASDWEDYVKICYSNSNNWNPQHTLVNVLLRGMLWLEAFEAHRVTGNDIHHYSRTSY